MSKGQTMEGQMMEGETSEGDTTDIRFISNWFDLKRKINLIYG